MWISNSDKKETTCSTEKKKKKKDETFYTSVQKQREFTNYKISLKEKLSQHSTVAPKTVWKIWNISAIACSNYSCIRKKKSTSTNS